MRQWRKRELARITSGVRALDAPTRVAERAAAYATVLPDDCAYSHLTAAALLGLPLPRETEQLAMSGPLDVIRTTEQGRVKRRGCRGRVGAERRDLIEVGGLRVTGPVDTWIDLPGGTGPQRLTLIDLVVAGDAVVARIDVEVELLRAGLARRGPVPGRQSLIDAIALIRPGVRSPMESRSRLVIARAGFPEPEVNARVHSEVDGGFPMECDLAWRERRVGVEYQGADHASIRRRSRDESRRAHAEDHGWTVLEMYAEDVYQGGRRRAFLRRLARRLGIHEAGLRIDDPIPVEDLARHSRRAS